MADLLVLVVSMAIVAQHILATRNHFVSERMTPAALLLAVLVVATALIYAILLFVTEQPVWATLIGVVLELASLALFRWAIVTSRQAKLRFAFDPLLPHGLLDRGPYRFVRHPFYTSYQLFWLGWAVAVWSIWTIPLLLCIILFYVLAARGEERRFAASDLSQAYERYRRGTGLFWPKLAAAFRRDDN